MKFNRPTDGMQDAVDTLLTKQLAYFTKMFYDGGAQMSLLFQIFLATMRSGSFMFNLQPREP